MLLDEDEIMDLRNILKDFINQKCLFICDPEMQYAPGIPKGTIPSSNPGVYATWQLYLRNLTQDSDMMAAAAMLILDQMEKNRESSNFQFVGLETSSIPLISSLQAHARRTGRNINSFSVRKERKHYGLFNFIDGIPNKYPICVVDDILNSTSSASRVMDTCLFELDLEPHAHSYFIMCFDEHRKHMHFNGSIIQVNTLFRKKDLDLEFSKDRYWVPFDCDRSFNKRPDYV